MPQYKLSYFDFAGSRGEECRIALHLAGHEFEDDRISFPQWAERKAQAPFGVLPVLEVEGKGAIADSNAILRYIGEPASLHPADPFEAARHEAVMNTIECMRAKVTPTLRMEEEQKKATREALAKDYLPDFGSNLEAEIRGPFLGGDKLQVADIKLYMAVRWFASGVVDHVPTDVYDHCPKLKALYEAVAADPGVQAWQAKSA